MYELNVREMLHVFLRVRQACGSIWLHEADVEDALILISTSFILAVPLFGAPLHRIFVARSPFQVTTLGGSALPSSGSLPTARSSGMRRDPSFPDLAFLIAMSGILEITTFGRRSLA